MRELVGTERDKHTEVLASDLRDSIHISEENQNEGEAQTASGNNVEAKDQPASDTVVVEDGSSTSRNASEAIVINDICSPPDKDELGSKLIQHDNIEVKKEELDGTKKFLVFTTEEDSFLKVGFTKYSESKRKWADILKDEKFKFQEGRTRDSLRVRATTLGLEKSKTKRKARSK